MPEDMVSQEPDLDDEFGYIQDEPGKERSGLRAWIRRTIWERIPVMYRQNLEPELLSINLIEGEEKQIEIHLAWYRSFVSDIAFGYFSWFLGLSLVFAIALYLLTRNTLISLIPFMIVLLIILEGIREYIEYQQWRLVKTNKRLIISLPQKDSWPLVDNIEIGDLPKVIDTNWSPNFVWRMFQFFTGARDLYISLTAFKFEEGQAKVRDALVIPDVMTEDVLKFKELVFGKK